VVLGLVGTLVICGRLSAPLDRGCRIDYSPSTARRVANGCARIGPEHHLVS
jgi:hypothetical protein